MRLRPEAALSLALLRIVVPPLLLLVPGFREGVRVAAWDHARWVVPEGLGWFVRVVPITPAWVEVAQIVMVFSALAAMLGLEARRAFAVLTLSGFYVLSVAQLTGFVWHDMHLLWFSAVLAVSPSSDVLSLEQNRPIDAEGIEYARPLWVVRLLFAAIYFFPGLHKLWTSGFAWALSDNLLNQLYWKWAQHGAPPPLRLDLHPNLLRAGGLFTLLFELSFPIMILFRRTRVLAAVLGIAFHLLSQAIFRIAFPSLWLGYSALVDVRPIARRLLKKRRPDEPEPDTSKNRVIAVGGLVLAGAVVQGARGQMQSYPFSCYPTFQWMAKSVMPDLEIDAVDESDRESPLVHARDARGHRTQREWGVVWRLAGATGPTDGKRLVAYLKSAVRRPENSAALARAKRVRFYRAMRSVKPDERERPPVTRHLLLEVPTVKP